MFWVFRSTHRFQSVISPILKRSRWSGRKNRRPRTDTSAVTETSSLGKQPVVGSGAESAWRVSQVGKKMWAFVRPIRFRHNGRYYTKEDVQLIFRRFPLWLVFAGLLSFEETSPFKLLRTSGPSMLPTMLPDGSEVWLSNTFLLSRIIPLIEPSIKVGDLVGFCPPDQKVVSCKRVIGVAGDTVPRYGQYVHLFLDQDPKHWGMSTWPEDDPGHHAWIQLDWDKTPCLRDKRAEAKRTLVVPEGHVWIEADCPAVGVDSRHFGPIPISWIRGKIICRIWPLSRMLTPLQDRPHPIPMDPETLSDYNVYMAIEEIKPNS